MTMVRPPRFPTPWWCAWCALLLFVGGCVSIPRSSKPPPAQVGAIRRDQTNVAMKVTATVLGAELGRFADELNALVAQASEQFAVEVGTPQARALALGWRAGAANNAMIIASGPNPIANLLDMIVMVSLGRMTFEEHWVPQYGAPAKPMLEACRTLEEEIWTVATRVLTPSQQTELRELIRAWREKHPDQVFIGVRLRDFSEIAATGANVASRKPGSVFGLLFLDPFAGLDPATREMQQTRYFADRALFVLQRMPTLLRLQSELLVYQSLASPDLQQALANSTRFVQVAEQLSQSIQKLPDQLSAEREKLMRDATAQAPQWQALLTQFEQTLKAGNEMAASVESATKSLDGFVGRFDRNRTTPPSTQSSPIAVGTNDVVPGRRFDVTEYGAAATEIARAAQQIDELVGSLEKSTPKLNAVVERTSLEGKELVDYAFRKAVWFVALCLLGVLLMLIVHRIVLVRWPMRPPP